MTSSDSRWADAKIAALANRDRAVRNAALVLSLMFFALMLLLCGVTLHHLAR